MKPYHDIPALHSLYLEDSYVMGIEERDGGISFTVDAVLTEDHPRLYDIAADWGHVQVHSARPPDVRYAEDGG
jgi:hypothetical protein